MVRFNISTYTTPLDDEKQYKNKLKLIHRFHKTPTIKESVDNKENIIKVPLVHIMILFNILLLCDTLIPH